MLDVGQSVRAARLAAGLSQRALARRCGVPSSTIGRIERGQVTPRLDTLGRLASALDADLSVRLHIPLLRRVARLSDEIVRVCQEHGAANPAVFGSAATGGDTADSDLDLLVDLGDDADLLTLVELEQALTDLLGVDVDVLPREVVTPTFDTGPVAALS